MCLAIVNQGNLISKEIFVTADIYNSDGMGMLWLDNRGDLQSHKQMGDVDSFYTEYLKVRLSQDKKAAQPKSAILIHFRLSTHGLKNVGNCHPFMVSKGVGFIHNGIFSSVPRHDKYSDTQMFNQLILQKLPKNFMGNDGIMELLDNYCGFGSKLAFLNDQGDVKIINEHRGTWEDGNWYSNNTGFCTYASLGYGKSSGNFKRVNYQKGWIWNHELGQYVDPNELTMTEEERWEAYWERKEMEGDTWEKAAQHLDSTRQPKAIEAPLPSDCDGMCG